MFVAVIADNDARIVSNEEWQQAKRTSRRDANTSGSRSPSTMARMIRIPVAPVISETT